jgi:hypothetical protein
VDMLSTSLGISLKSVIKVSGSHYIRSQGITQK